MRATEEAQEPDRGVGAVGLQPAVQLESLLPTLLRGDRLLCLFLVSESALQPSRTPDVTLPPPAPRDQLAHPPSRHHVVTPLRGSQLAGAECTPRQIL